MQPLGLDVHVEEDETLFDAAWREGWDWPTVCLGQMRCTACHVIVRAGSENVLPVKEADERAAIRRVARRLYGGAEDGVRLACQLRIAGDVTVEQSAFAGEVRADADPSANRA